MVKSIMIVDDSATMRKIIIRTVEMAGLEFESAEQASNGTEALKKLQDNAVDILLCDINMPEMSGTELVKKVRQLPNCQDIKIIMVSTESSLKIVETLMANGADGFITKPFTPEKFKEQLSSLLKFEEQPSI